VECDVVLGSGSGLWCGARHIDALRTTTRTWIPVADRRRRARLRSPRPHHRGLGVARVLARSGDRSGSARAPRLRAPRSRCRVARST
jgi:hypothetical protein